MLDKTLVPNRKNNELVVEHLWPHPVIFAKVFIVYIVLFLIPLFLYLLLSLVWPSVLEGQVSLPFLTLLCFAYYLVILLLVFFVWMDNYLDVWTITTHRVISRQQNGLFNRKVAELELYRIQDVMVQQKGFLPTIFNYGDLYIQTAGQQERFVLKEVAEPIRVSRLIQKMDEEAKHSLSLSIT